MTERQKMQTGLLYDANDAELVKARAACKELCYDFNQLRPSQEIEQDALLRRLLGQTGTHFTICAPFWCDYGSNISIGENFFANHGCVILDGARVAFGDNVFIAPNCGFHTAGHPLDAKPRRLGLEYAYPITIGDDVWIGAGTQVLPGVTIGSGTVIGAGSVVNRDIPPGWVAAGNPCRPIRPIHAGDHESML